MFTLPWSHGPERGAYWRSLLAQHLVGERLDDAGDLGVFQIGAVVLSVQHHPFAVRHHPLDSVEPLAPQLCFAGVGGRDRLRRALGGVRVRLARPLLERRPELERYGWDVGYFALGCCCWFTKGCCWARRWRSRWASPRTFHLLLSVPALVIVLL
jgi:hypothetical protein